MPARLADGLEAKKSSSEVSDTPRAFISIKACGSPALSAKNSFGNLFLLILGKRFEKGKIFSWGVGETKKTRRIRLLRSESRTVRVDSCDFAVPAP